MGVRGTGRLYLRGGDTGVWWLELRGHRMSTGVRGAPDKKGNPPRAAEEFRAKKLIDYGLGEPLRPETVTFEDLAQAITDTYRAKQAKSLPNLLARLKSLSSEFARTRASHITEERILAYAVKRRDVDGAAVATVNLELNFLRRAFSLLRKRFPHPPTIRRLPGERVRQGTIDEHTREAILAHVRAELVPPFRFMSLTGWRIGETLALEWTRVDTNAREVYLHTSKNGEPRTLSYGNYPPLMELIRERELARDEIRTRLGRIVPYVFFRPNGARITDSSAEGVWARARVKAGFPKAIPHDFRRSMVRRMEQAGVPRSVGMTITGHRSEEAYRRYAIVRVRDQDEAFDRLSRASGINPVVAPFVATKK